MSSDREEDTLPVTDAAAEAEESSNDSESDQDPQPSTSTQVASGEGGGAVVLSKSSLKRIAYLKRTNQLEKAKQLEEQLTKRAKKARKKERRRKEGKLPHRNRNRDNDADYSNTDMTVVCDLSFENLMNDKQIEKCAHELGLIYDMNRRSKKPIPLYWTGIPAGGAMEKHMARHDANRNWDVKYSSESFVDLFDPNRLVYLTRDSDVVLTKLEKGTVYVIGGLVDPRQNKGHCLELANAMNIRHARLPLREHIKIQNHQTVLSIIQVFEILMKFQQSRSWRYTLQKVLKGKRNPIPVDTAERTKKAEESADNGMAVQ